ncbi:MAG TPA: M48 family metalloprotease [Pyrinomonadaceae bacterium]|jgi:WD40 repeat protein
MRKSYLFLPLLLISLMFGANAASAQSECQPPAIIFNNNAQNIFTEQQEMALGEAMVEQLQKNYRVIDDESVNAYLQSIGDRISRHLPKTNLKFRFYVVDLPDTNAFAFAGGKIFVTRKLISFTRSEDELAGIIGHELGHATVRHGAIDFSKYFKQILNVTSFKDNRDVVDKYHQLIDKWNTKQIRFESNHEDEQQLEADRVAMYAMIAAGYDPNVFTAFWRRFTEAKKTNVLTNFLGVAKSADKRLTEMIEVVKATPAKCLDKSPAHTKEDYEKWRAFVINYSGLGTKESLNGLILRRNLVPLRSDIEHFRFSPNGNFVLAQDNSGVSILSRAPFKLLFRIDAEDALPAAFTPDSSTVVVYNRNLRVQKWSVAEKSLISTHEVAVPRGYWQAEISPDGNTLASYEFSGDLTLYDVATNEPIFREKEFYVPSYLEYYAWTSFMEILELDQLPIFNIKFSPDGHYFLAGRKVGDAWNGSRQEAIAVDISTRKKISLGDNVKKLLFTSFAFLAPDKIVGQYGKELEKSGVFSFPSGERVEQFELSGKSFTKAERGDYVLVRPVSGAAVGVYDLKARKYILANKKAALDVYENYFITELRSGEIALFPFGQKEPLAVLNLPPSPFGSLRTTALSPDANWLAASDRSRGAVWNLQTGERVLHIRGFRGSYFAPDGLVYADFPKQEKNERTIAAMDTRNLDVVPGNPVTDKNMRQYGQFLVALKDMKDQTAKEEKEKAKEKNPAYVEEEREKRVGTRETIMEVRDAQTGATLWTRQFNEETPRYFVSPARETMTLAWELSSKAAKNIIKTDAGLSAKLSAMQEKTGDFFFQILDPKTGKVTGQFLLETGEGSFTVRNATAAGDYLVIADDENRILIYSISQGRLLQRFFGSRATISPTTSLIAIANVPGRITVYDIATGTERERLSFTKNISVAQFADDGKRLFILTADQTAFLFDTSKFGSTAPDSTK